jgi:hypothetical protein
MKLHRLLLALVVVAGLVGMAYVGQTAEPAAAKMAGAADKLLASLKPEQKAKASFAFDDKERTNWHFVPRQTPDKKPTRKGLPLEEMTEEQKAAALALLKAGTSADGYTKATTIMSLESILHDLEQNGQMVRNPDWYFVTIFGSPSKTAKWGWRIEGHHLSLNFTLDGGRVVSSTPAFFGANPAIVKDGKRKGLRTLPEAEDSARELFTSLDPDQRAAALQKEQFKETPEEKTAPDVGEPKGLAAAKMNDKQRDVLRKLIEGYAARMPEDVAEVELKQVKDAGLDKVYFAYWGGNEPGQAYTYHVLGPTFIIEFLNVQADSAKNPANHIHSSWRNVKGDFGLAAN